MTKVVYLNDEKIAYSEARRYFNEAADWARNQCHSYIDCHVQDVSDVSLIWDYIAAYHFKDPKDALMFELKWK